MRRISLTVTLLAVLPSACGSASYSARLETPGSDLKGPPIRPNAFVIGNTGKVIQNVVLTAETHGTQSIRTVSVYLQLDPGIVKVDYSKGGVYLPQHWVRAILLHHRGTYWTWQVGDLPAGYRLVATFRTHRRGPRPRRGFLLNINWYAVSSPNQPRSTWQHLTRLYAAT